MRKPTAKTRFCDGRMGRGPMGNVECNAGIWEYFSANHVDFVYSACTNSLTVKDVQPTPGQDYGLKHRLRRAGGPLAAHGSKAISRTDTRRCR